MPTPSKVPQSKSKKVEVKTQAQTYSAVRLSMVVMTSIAMLCTSFVLAALLIRLVPVKDSGSSVATGPKVTKSANGFVAGELLVKFASNSTQLSRTQAVQKALQKPVKVTTVTPVKQRSGLRTVTRNVESVSQKIATLKSLTPVVESSVPLTNVANATRAKRGASADVVGTAGTLRQWYVVRVSPAAADLNQVAANLRKQAGVEKVETNRKVSIAAVRSISSTSAGATIKLSDAQKASAPLAGDANNDSVVDGKDLRMLINYLTVTNGPKPTNMAAADINHDGIVDIADLSRLIAMLMPSTKFTPRDLTGDGSFDIADLTFLIAYLTQRGPAPSPLSAADWDGSGVVDLTDLSYMVSYLYGDWNSETMQYGSGDVNGDGEVNELDIQALAAYLTGAGPAPSPLSVADLDLDGRVDITDLTYLISRVYNIAGGSGDSESVNAAALPSANVSSDTDTPSSATYVPTYLVGDANADSSVNAKDLDFLVKYLIAEGPAPSPLLRADFDGDGMVDIADLTWLVSIVSRTVTTRLAAADLNADGKVDQGDVKVLAAYLSAESPTIDLLKADVTFDGTVDISDLSVLIDYVLNHSTTPPTCPAIRTVGNVSFLNGDFNGDGAITSGDGIALAKYVYTKAAAPNPTERADINCDSAVNGFDVAAFATVESAQLGVKLPTANLLGDANADGAVNATDIVKNFATILDGVKAPEADVNRNGVIDYQDTYDLVVLLHLDKATKALVDLTGDGKVTRADASKLMNDVVDGTAATADATADVNGDGAVNVADAIAYVKAIDAQAPSTAVLAGDVNADGNVTCDDAKALYATQYKNGPAITPALRADVNNDGRGNAVDLFLLAQRTCGNDPVLPPANIRIALLDSGVRLTVDEAKDVIATTSEVTNKIDSDSNGYVDDVQGWNTLSNTPVVTDCQGHGNALSKMLATGTGVSPLAKVIPVRAVDCKGNGTTLSVANGLVYATVRGADIAEVPLSGVGTSVLLADVVRFARASGMLVVSAAGNDAKPASQNVPANVSGVLSVGATTSNGKGLTSYTNTGAKVNAPGAALGVSFEGTSVSATYVAGTAALALMKNPALTLQALEAKLIPVTPVVNPKNVKVLDAVKAVQ